LSSSSPHWRARPMPTYPAEFEIGQPVVLCIEGQEYRSTITRAYWDAGAEDWF